jgi:hypothetical protein
MKACKAARANSIFWRVIVAAGSQRRFTQIREAVQEISRSRTTIKKFVTTLSPPQ